MRRPGSWRVVGVERAPERLGAIPAGYAWVVPPCPLPPFEVPRSLINQAAMRNCLLEARLGAPKGTTERYEAPPSYLDGEDG